MYVYGLDREVLTKRLLMHGHLQMLLLLPALSPPALRMRRWSETRSSHPPTGARFCGQSGTSQFHRVDGSLLFSRPLRPLKTPNCDCWGLFGGYWGPLRSYLAFVLDWDTIEGL